MCNKGKERTFILSQLLETQPLNTNCMNITPISISVDLALLLSLTNINKAKINSASTTGGPHSRVCACETICSAPIDTSSIFPVNVSAESPSMISPTLKKSYPMFQDPKTARFAFCPPKIGLFRGVGGFPTKNLSLES